MLCFLFFVCANIRNFHQPKSQKKQGFTRQFDLFLFKIVHGIKIDLNLSKKKIENEL